MTRQETAGALADSVEVRERLVEALNLDLIGPWGGHALAAERLPGWVRPSNWYLTGFLIPSGTKPESSADADEQDDIDETPESSGLAEESSEERKAAKKGFFPSSMGLSFLVAADADALAVIVRWGDYEPARVEGADGKSDSAWVRESNERTVPVALSGAGAHRRGDHAVPDSAGLTLHVDERPIRTDALAEIPAGTRSVSVFLVNGRAPDDDNPDRNYAFQAEIEVRGRQPFVPRPDPRGVQAAGWDDRVADLHYADTPEYATGHGVSADWEVVEGACRMLRTAWIPRADVEETKTAGVPGAVLSMDALGALPDAQTARVALRPLVDQYRVWIELRRAEIETLPDARRIQDELHLISGPLGTMVGLYESVIDALCARAVGDRSVRPKIVASTATARQARDQIQALFARRVTHVFPPPGPNRRDSFFARTMPVDAVAGRRYLGIASPGRNPKVLMRRVWLALMGAAERAYRDAGGHENHDNPADPYMTVLGYFNSLRELGGARRILEEEVRNTLRQYGQRRRIGESHGLFRDRRTFSDVVELTSRVSTDRVADARRRLERAFHETDRVDCAIATNMISVGLNIPRLGLMVVLSQPKTHAEYIQATSRVGRAARRPGLVVTLLNVHKPRDRSHYERFRHYHQTFYRSVEVSSVTPFSARALDRGLAGALVALARHAEAKLTPPSGVERLAEVRAGLEGRLLQSFGERVDRQPFADDAEGAERLVNVRSRVVDLLDSWRTVVDDYHADNVTVKYQHYEMKQGRPLLREMLDTEFESEHHRKFRANRSLRDVEPEVDLYIREPTGRDVEP